MAFLETTVYYLDDRREVEESWVLSFHWQYFNLLSDCSLFLKKMFDAFLGRPGGTLSLQTKTTEVRNIYMVYQQVISLVSLSRPQRFFGSLLDAFFYRLFNILHWTSSTPSSTDSIVRGATADI